jgi:hypothetical protein
VKGERSESFLGLPPLELEELDPLEVEASKSLPPAARKGQARWEGPELARLGVEQASLLEWRWEITVRLICDGVLAWKCLLVMPSMSSIRSSS